MYRRHNGMWTALLTSQSLEVQGHNASTVAPAQCPSSLLQPPSGPACLRSPWSPLVLHCLAVALKVATVLTGAQTYKICTRARLLRQHGEGDGPYSMPPDDSPGLVRLPPRPSAVGNTVTMSLQTAVPRAFASFLGRAPAALGQGLLGSSSSGFKGRGFNGRL